MPGATAGGVHVFVQRPPAAGVSDRGRDEGQREPTRKQLHEKVPEPLTSEGGQNKFDDLGGVGELKQALP